MKLRWAHYLIVFAGVYLLFLIVNIPATLVSSQVRDQLPGLTLYGVHGTVWSGSADSLAYGTLHAQNVRWSLRALPLLFGRVEIAWALDAPGLHGRGKLGRTLGGSIYVSDLVAEAPVASLQALSPYKLPLPLAGIASLDLRSVRLDDGALREADGVVDLKSAALKAPNLKLGDFRITMETDDAGTKATLADRGGPLQAQGIAMLKPDGSYQFNGSFASRDNDQPALERYLRLFGRPGPDGKVQVSTTGRL